MKSYFEGWYFKHQKDNNSIAFIPGINIERNGEKHAFIQIIANKDSYNIPYDISDFKIEKYEKHCPVIEIDGNSFSPYGAKININNENISIKGIITYGSLSPIKYDIMGPLKYIPFMECKHGIISMQHTLSGFLDYNDKHMDMDNGTGYIETDRGSSFPDNYLWTQCNYNNRSDINIVMAAATVPMCGFSFKGGFAIVKTENKEYRMATYLGGHITEFNKKYIKMVQGKYSLKARLIKESPCKLMAPSFGAMNRTIHENVFCTVEYEFCINDRPEFVILSDASSFEYA